MSRFFNFFAILCGLLLFAALVVGHFHTALGIGASTHLLLGLSAAILSVSLHCLIFGIFTGSGKDTRLLVQDLKLDPQAVARTKAFRRTVFPPALYAILLLVMATTLGGALSSLGSFWLRALHTAMAWFGFLYNVKTFLLEARAVRENAEILATVNREAEIATETRGALRPVRPDEPAILGDALEEVEWGAHVFALGKFLTFLGWNTWLPYLYVRFIMGYIRTPLWPFSATSAAFLLGGYYLRWRYQGFQPRTPGLTTSSLPPVKP